MQPSLKGKSEGRLPAKEPLTMPANQTPRTSRSTISSKTRPARAAALALEPLEPRQLLSLSAHDQRAAFAAAPAGRWHAAGDPPTDRLMLESRSQDLAAAIVHTAAKKTPKPPPVGVLNASISGPPNASGVVVISGKTSAKAKIQVEIGKGGPVTASTTADKKGNFQVSVTVQFGNTNLYVLATAGKKQFAAGFSVTRQIPDTTPPVIAVTAVKPGTVIKTNATISGAVSDIGSGVAAMTEQVDNGPIAVVPLGFGGQFQISTGFPLNGTADGAHVVHLVATDHAGNVSAPTNVTLILDTSLPVVTIATPSQGLLTAHDPAVSGRISAGPAGLATALAQVDSGAVTPIAVSSSGQFSFPITLPTNGSADGAHSVRVFGVDGAGNVGVSPAVTFTLDTIPPATPNFDLDPASQSTPGSDQTTFASVTFDGQTSPNTAVALVGTSQTATSDALGKFHFSNVPLSLGANIFTVRATDAAGNTSTASRTVTRVTSSGGAPVLNPISDITLSPGGRAQVKLQATDPGGLALTYALSNDSGGPIPTGSLAADGTMTFAPTPAELGTYHLTAVASDGTLQGTQQFTLSVVADPVTTTRISGVVEDANGTPLAGVPVSIGSVSRKTGANGAFSLDLGQGTPTATTITVSGDQFSGAASYPHVTLNFNLALDHPVYAGFNNAFTQPIYLSAINPASSVTVNPAQLTTLTNPAIPGAKILINAGTLLNAQGQTYSGKISLVAVPTNRLPAALPAGMNPSQVYMIEPAGLSFSQAPSMTLPNAGGYQPGVEMEVQTMDPATGSVSGSFFGTVSADGKTVDPAGGGSTGFYVLVWPKPFQHPLPPKTQKDPCKCCEDGETGDGLGQSSAADANASLIPIKTGNLQQSQQLTGYSDQGSSQGLSLVYDSLRADPSPIVKIPFNFDPFSFPNDSGARLVASLSVSDGGFSEAMAGGENYWTLPTSATGVQDLQTGLVADMRNFATGTYNYSVNVGVERAGTSGTLDGSTTTMSDQISLVNEMNSPFGSGWQIKGYQWITPNADGSVLLANGDGSSFHFGAPTSPGQAYQAPAGEFLSLVKETDGSFQLSTTDHTVTTFNATGKPLTVADRNGNTTHYAYGANGLTQIVDPVGQATTFTYTGSHVSSVTDPAGRVTQLTYDAAGNLASMIAPDNSSTSWKYDATHHLSSVTDGLNLMKSFTYDFAGTVKKETLADGSVTQFSAEMAQGLLPAGETRSPAQAPLAPAAPAEDIGTVTDANGNTDTIVLDDTGDALSRLDSIGTRFTNVLGPNDQVAVHTDALGNLTLYTYDANGNIVSKQNAQTAGSIVRGDLTATTQVDRYSFTVPAGERIYFNALGTEPAGLSVTLVQPDGTNDGAFNGGAGDIGPVALSQAGTYTLEVTGATGAYAFQVIDATKAAALPLGQTLSGAISPNLGVSLYQYNAKAGARLLIDDLSNASPGTSNSSTHVVWTVDGPDNTPIANSLNSLTGSNQTFEATLPASGTYIVVGSLSSTGGGTSSAPALYSVLFANPSTTSATLAYDTDTVANFNSPGAQINYTFTGGVGQELIFLPGTLGDLSQADLIAPSGATLDLRTLGLRTPFFLTESGTYALSLSDLSAGSFPFRLATVANLPSLALGTTVNGTVNESAPQQVYQIQGKAGHRLSINLAETESMGPLLQVYGPSGQSFLNGATITLPADGAYLVMVYGFTTLNSQTGQTQPITGSYQLTVTDVSDTPVAPSGFGIVHSGTVTFTQPATATFTAPAGRVVEFDSLNTSQSLSVTITDPSGVVDTQNLSTGSDSGPIILPLSGTYKVTVSGGSGSFSYQMLDLTAAPALTLGTTIDKTITTPFASDVYQFTGTAGKQIYFDGRKVTQNAVTVSVFGPGGEINTPQNGTPNPLFSQGADTDFGPLTLTAPGTYYVVFDNHINSLFGPPPIGPGEYNFRVLDPSTAPLLTDDTMLSDTLSTPSQTNLYRLAGQAGATLFATFPTTSDQFGVQGELYAPGVTPNDQVFGGSFVPGTEFFASSVLYQPLTVGGTYLVAITDSSSGTSPISYSLRTSLHAASTSTLTLGQSATAVIAQAGQRVEYTMSLSADQRLFFNGLDASAGANLTLLDPDGSVDRAIGSLFTSADSSNELFITPQTGVYRLEVSASNAGSYSFVVSDVDAGAPMLLDSLTPGHLSNAQQTELFHFNGSAGQRLYFGHAADPAHPFLGEWTLFGPDGTAVPSNDLEFIDSSTDFIATLPTAGSYVLALSQPGAIGPQNFNFEVNNATINTSTINVDGSVVSGSITAPGERNIYTFNGTAGVRLLAVQLNSFGTGSISSLTINGGGQTRVLSAGAPVSLLLPQTGSYQVVVPTTDGPTGTYSFQLINTDAAPAIILAQNASGSLVANAVDAYSLTGKAGQRLHFHTVATGGNPSSASWGLYDPNFNLIASNNLPGDFDATLPTDGTYVLLVGNSMDAMTYSVQVTQIADTPVPASGFGTVHSGTMAAGQTITFTYTAPAGLPIYYDMLSDSFGSASLYMTAPDGSFILNAPFDDQGPIILPMSGTYTVTIQGFQPSDTGTFDFCILDLTTAPSLTLGTTTSGTLSNSLASDFYQFSGSLGQRLFFDSQAGNASVMSYELFQPADSSGSTLITGPTSAKGAPFTLAETGTYYLVVVGQSAGTPRYSFRLSDVASAPALTLGQATSGQINPSTSASIYSISGTSGETLNFHDISTSDPTGATWSLYDPSNAVVGSGPTSLGTDFSATLASGGTYLLALADPTASAAVNYSIVVSQPSTTGTGTTTPITLLTGAEGGTQTTYDSTFGQVLSQTDALGRETLISIDPGNGNVLSKTLVSASGNEVTTYTYTPDGMLATVTDPLGRKTAYAYDQFDRLTAATQGAGTPLAATTHYEYDAAGDMTARTDPNGNRAQYAYDTRGRLLSTIAPDGGVTKYTYDADGNTTSTTDPLGHTTAYSYDSRNRLVKTTDPSGGLTQNQYDGNGNLVATIDTLGNKTSYQYDTRNRLVTTTDATGAKTQQAYDANNELASITDADGNVTSYVFNSQGQVVSQTSPLGTEKITHNAVGQVTSVTDATGRQIDYTYDDLGHMVQETWVGGNDAIHYTFDAANQLTAMTDNNSSVTYTYDALGRIATATTSGAQGSPTVTITYQYSADGEITLVSDSAGGNTSYTYNSQNQITQIAQSGTGVQPKSVQFSYDTAGQATSLKDFSDTTGSSLVVATALTEDASGRLTQLRYTNGSGASLASYGYTYNANNQIAQATSVDGTTTYGYDARGALTSASNSAPSNPSSTYSYDANGNQSGASSQITAGNLLKTDGTYNYQYDADGNLVLKTTIATGATQSYSWDYRNRLVSVVNKDGSGSQTEQITYTYDALNRRISETIQTASGSATTYFAFDRTDPILEYHSTGAAGSPALSERYLNGPAVDQVLAQEDGSGHVLWLLADGNGDVRDIVDNSGNLVDHRVYNPYGVVESETNPSLLVRNGFAGMTLDFATGLYQDSARVYSPSTGRYLSQDPIGFASGQSNSFAYVADDPVNAKDPSGMVTDGGKAFNDYNCDELGQMLNRIYQLLYDEQKYGTQEAARRASNTWGSDPLGPLFGNGAVPSRYGDLDLDWATDLLSVAKNAADARSWYEGGKLAESVGDGLYTAIFKQKLGGLHSPYADPKEVNVLNAFADGNMTFASLLDNTVNMFQSRLKDLKCKCAKAT
jgi:RHS repeat-associated protein